MLLKRGSELLYAKPGLVDDCAQSTRGKVLAMMYGHGEWGTPRTLEPDVRTGLADDTVSESFEGSDGLPAGAVGEPGHEGVR